MTSVDSGSTATQKYNALGQRVERFLTNGSWTFDYLFSAAGEELGLYSAGTSAWFDQNVPMAGRVLVMYGSPSRFLHTNKLGTTTVTTDQTGAELQDELFYPWGQDWTRAGQPYVMHFAGMHAFENPGLVYPTDFRKYNPALGRWMSPDPLAGDVSNPQSLNRYAYVLNNPVSNIDPSGLEQCRPGARNYENDCADDGASVDVQLINDYNNRGLVPPLAPVLPGSGASNSGGEGGASAAPNNQLTPGHCVKQTTDYFNLQNGLKGLTGGRLGTSWLSGAFLGSSVSSGITVLQYINSKISHGAGGPGSREAAGAVSGEAIADASGPASSSLAKKVPNLAITASAGMSTTIETSSSVTTLSVEASATASIPLSSALSAAGKLFSGFGAFKLPYDLAVGGLAAVGCAALNDY